MAKPHATKDLQPVGTHVPYTRKLALEALAKSQGTTTYKLLQDKIMEMTEGIEVTITIPGQEAVAASEVEEDSGTELLG